MISGPCCGGVWKLPSLQESKPLCPGRMGAGVAEEFKGL